MLVAVRFLAYISRYLSFFLNGAPIFRGAKCPTNFQKNNIFSKFTPNMGGASAMKKMGRIVGHFSREKMPAPEQPDYDSAGVE